MFLRAPGWPTAESAARRALALKYVVAYAQVAPSRKSVTESMREWTPEKCQEFHRNAAKFRKDFWSAAGNVTRDLTPIEREFARTTMATMTAEQQCRAMGRKESLCALLWALSIVPEIAPYDAALDDGDVQEFAPKDRNAFLQSVSLRTESELEREREKAELWHWRSNTRAQIERGDPCLDTPWTRAAGLHTHDDIVRLKSRRAYEEGTLTQTIDCDFAAFGKAYRDLDSDEWNAVRSISTERHFALNWLCGRAPSNRWEDTPTDT